MSKEAYAYELLGAQKERARQAAYLSKQYWDLVNKAADLLHESAHDLMQGQHGEGAEVMNRLAQDKVSLQKVMGWKHRDIEGSLLPILRGTSREPKLDWEDRLDRDLSEVKS